MTRKRAKGTWQKKKQLTKNQKEWYAQIAQINRKITGAEKRGFRFTQWEAPTKPQRIQQKNLEELKQLKKNIYEYAIYVTPQGTTISGIEGVKYEHKMRAKKAAETRKRKALGSQDEYDSDSDYNPPPISDTVLTWVEEQLNSWSAPEGTASYQRYKYAHTDTLQSILNNEIARKGRDFVAENLEKNAYTIKDDVSTILFDSNQTQVELAFNRFLEALYDRPLDLSESVEITDYAERSSSYDDV